MAQSALRLEKAIIFGHHHRPAGSPGAIDDSSSLPEAASEGLLDHHRKPRVNCLKSMLRVQRRRTGNQHGISPVPRQSIPKAFAKRPVLLARRAARGVQSFLVYIHTSDSSEVGVLMDKIEPMAPPAPNSNVDDSYSHSQSLCFRGLLRSRWFKSFM
jgi:hypothetical protein